MRVVDDAVGFAAVKVFGFALLDAIFGAAERVVGFGEVKGAGFGKGEGMEGAQECSEVAGAEVLFFGGEGLEESGGERDALYFGIADEKELVVLLLA